MAESMGIDMGQDIHLAANGCVKVIGSVNGTANLSVADTTVGGTVLSGSNVSAQYGSFTFGDGSMLISSTGVLTAA